MDTFNLMNTLWPSNAANPNNNLNLNLQFHHNDSSNSLPNNMPPPHFFLPPTNKLLECPTFNNDHPTNPLMNVSCDLQHLLNCMNASSTASALATQTQMFEAKHSADLMASEQTTTALPSCSNTNLFQTSELSTSTSSLLSENLHEHEAKQERAVLPQSAGFPAIPTQFDDQQHLSSNSSPGSSSLASTFPMFPIMSTADNFLMAALNTLLASTDSDSDPLSTDGAAFSGDLKNVVLCQVCSDKASGLHYGVTSCEGCKGFFRRSIQQQLSYRPCTKNQKCAIVRNNRNRCQSCRLRKCLDVGMSRDAVRFGRIPKKEKTKMVEEMQRASIRSRIDSMTVELEDDQLLLACIHSAFVELGDNIQRDIVNTPASNFMIGDGHENLLNSSHYLPAIISVVNFAKSVKGFQLLYQNDRVQLLKSSFFQILLLRLSALKVNNKSELLDASAIPQLLFLNNSLMDKSDSLSLLRNSIVEFVQRFRLLGLNEQQQCLVASLVLCQSEATATQFQEPTLSKMLNEKLWWLLQNSIFPSQQAINSITGPMLIQSLFAIFADLKAINSIYQEQMQHLRCYTLSAPTSIESSLQLETRVAEHKPALPQIQRPCPKKPKISKLNADKMREKNKLLAELLEQPSKIAPPKLEQNEEDGGDEDSDQPLNLCVRDQQRQNNSS